MITETRIYVLDEQGEPDWYFIGDGDQVTPEAQADLYASENPDARLVVITLTETAREAYVPEPD